MNTISVFTMEIINLPGMDDVPHQCIIMSNKKAEEVFWEFKGIDGVGELSNKKITHKGEKIVSGSALIADEEVEITIDGRKKCITL